MTTTKDDTSLQFLEDDDIYKFETGMSVEGMIVDKTEKFVLIDFNGKITGVVAGKELHDDLKTFDSLNVGDNAKVIVIDSENEDGYLNLSFRKAGQLRAWERFHEYYKEQTTFDVKPTAANKGGVVVDIYGIKALIQVSQLSHKNYQRVDDTN